MYQYLGKACGSENMGYTHTHTHKYNANVMPVVNIPPDHMESKDATPAHCSAKLPECSSINRAHS